MNSDIKLQFDSSIEHIESINESFSSGTMRICYHGKNRNNSNISREAIEQAKETMFNCPVVCNYSIEDDVIGGHDMALASSADGGMRLVNLTDAIGVVPSGAKTWWEKIDDNGTEHEYFSTEIILWKRSPAYKKIVDDGITSQSMEITVKDGRMDDGVFMIDNFVFTAFCLLGDGIEPCFESASLQMFDRDHVKHQFSLLMQDLKESLTQVNTSKEVDNIMNYSTEGGEKVLDEKKNLAAEYGIDIDSLDFSIEDFTAEELKKKFETIKADDKTAESEASTEETPDEETSVDDTEKSVESEGKFSLTQNVVEEICHALSTEKIQYEWGDIERYGYVDCDIEAKEVYCVDREDWILYGFKYTVDGDAIKIDFESKTRKKFAIVDFEGGEQNSPIAPVFELMDKKLKEYGEFETKFNTASETIASLNTELEELRKFKADTESAVAKDQRDAILAKFNDLDGIESFEVLRENCMNYDLETLEEKCFAIRGRNGTVSKFALENKAPKLKVDKTEITNEPYGGLFIKYAAKGSD